jgi:hypothetical protein
MIMFRIFTVIICLVFLPAMVKAQKIEELHLLSSYVNGVLETAEAVAYDADNKQVYFTASSQNTLTILDVANPKLPVKVLTIDLSSYGAGPNSVDYKNGIVAVAVESSPKTDAGFVVFFDKDGAFLHQVTVGSLPDMLTFNHDGTMIVVANEGEPNDDYTVDPEGSISVIDLSAGVTSANVSHITFESYNDKKTSLQNKGIRIFGNNGTATVAQDLEPEYITITADGKLAYVSCQENNALAVIDLASKTVLDLLPLGYKNHMLGSPEVALYNINELVTNWPPVGTPIYNGGQAEVMLGGFSGLFYSEVESSEVESVFYAVPDRGPNTDPVAKATVVPVPAQNLRPFKLPDYQARIVKFTLNHNTGSVELNKQIMLTRQDGSTPISGKGNIPGYDEVPVTFADAETDFSNEDYTGANGVKYHALPYDEMGGDMEGVLIDKNGDFWLCDENSPAIFQFDADGVLKHRYLPQGASQLGINPQPAGTYGEETLPEVYSKRWSNRGFEGIAYDKDAHVIYAFIQSPMYNPGSSTKDNSDIIRILGIDANDGTPVSEYVYLLERNKYAGYSASRTDKIGDACFIGNGKFLVLERDSEGPLNNEGKKYVFEINLLGATNILELPISAGTLELNSADELAAMGIQAVHKIKVVNLPSVGYISSDKVEGIALLPNNRIAVINDNDFGLAGAGITDNSVLGIISFKDNFGFDASDKDSKVDIKAHPTLGMLLPDAISSYQVNGKTYIVTANEGDSRDYTAYSEEVRVKNLSLDPIAYPDGDDLKLDANLGRLKTTTSMGDYDGDGDIDQIYSFGGRSFSIFDQYGNLVYDSGDDFAQISLENEPDLFNEDGGDKDGRSDDKGVEPESISIGEIDGKYYAFIGCERNSAIFVYDISNPVTPEFMTYYTNRDGTQGGDIGPEIIRFVSAENSPNGENILIIGYEVSGSVGFIQIDGDALTAISEMSQAAEFKLYPNPVTNLIRMNKKLSGSIFNTQGVRVKTFTNTESVNISDLEEGVYIITTNDAGSKRFLKK